MQAKVQGNWAISSYTALFVLFSFYIVDHWQEFRREMKLFIGISILFFFFNNICGTFPLFGSTAGEN